eukprot:1160104-Pelagomonas_calceolata.AAC.15
MHNKNGAHMRLATPTAEYDPSLLTAKLCLPLLESYHPTMSNFVSQQWSSVRKQAVPEYRLPCTVHRLQLCPLQTCCFEHIPSCAYSVASLGGHLAPGLKLLALELELSSMQLAHLYPEAPLVNQAQQQQQHDAQQPSAPAAHAIPNTPRSALSRSTASAPSAAVPPAKWSTADSSHADHRGRERPPHQVKSTCQGRGMNSSRSSPQERAVADESKPWCMPEADPDAGTAYLSQTRPGSTCSAWAGFGLFAWKGAFPGRLEVRGCGIRCVRSCDIGGLKCMDVGSGHQRDAAPVDLERQKIGRNVWQGGI